MRRYGTATGSAGTGRCTPYRWTGQPVGRRDWIVDPAAELATPLPGWFTVDHGLVRPRKGVVGLPLREGSCSPPGPTSSPDAATAHRLATASDGLVTVAVTARAGGFLVGDYGGTQRVYSGGQLAALLGDLPLYGSDLRLWLTWPSDPDEQQSPGGAGAGAGRDHRRHGLDAAAGR